MRFSLFFTTIFSLISFTNLYGQNVPLSNYEGYYLKTGTYPDDNTNWWMYNGLEVQGVTHDDNNWYFTLTTKGGGNGMLRRIPKSVALEGGSIQPSNPEIKLRTMSEVPELAPNYWHWGAPDHFRYNEKDYILIPIPGLLIACFQADNLEFINYANLNAVIQDYAGWCAVGADSNIYTSSNHAWGVHRYDVDWDKLTTKSSDHSAMNYIQSYPFLDENGSPLQLFHMQGGDFTPSGDLLYLVCGSAGCDALGWFGPTFGPGEPMPTDGIHVFETVSWKQVQRSTNAQGGTTFFNYNFDNDCTCVNTGSQSPEGLTIWDLDDGTAPNISGQLHVIKDHYNMVCDDAITMQHFSFNVNIDNNLGVNPPTNPLTGTFSNPFINLNTAYNFYPIWDGAQMVLKSGIYNDTGIYNKRIRITSSGGAAIIGQQ